MADHAKLSPSGASRWLECTPSAHLEESFPDSAGTAAQEGTLAHELGELLIRAELDRCTDKDFLRLEEIPSEALYQPEMLRYCEDYRDFVLERYWLASGSSPAEVKLEAKLNLTEYVPEGFGTSDVVIIADGTMEIIDLKYGKGVAVSCIENKQMMLYALGALYEYDLAYDIHTVRMTIFQPRVDNISSWEIGAEELKQWGEEYLRPKAILAYEGKGEFKPGDHCRFCRAKPICKALADYNLEIAKYEFRESTTLSDAEVADILNRTDMFTSWIKAVNDYALAEAVNNGKQWEGYKLVEGRSVRSYTNQDEVVKRLTESGYQEALLYKPKELLGITALSGTIGKKNFESLLVDLLVKPQGKPTLAPLSDKRPPLNSTESAQSDFSDSLL